MIPCYSSIYIRGAYVNCRSADAVLLSRHVPFDCEMCYLNGGGLGRTLSTLSRMSYHFAKRWTLLITTTAHHVKGAEVIRLFRLILQMFEIVFDNIG